MAKQKVMTELGKLKKKCLKDGLPRSDARSHDLVRLKQLQDGEPLSKAELEEAQKREAEKKEKDISDYKEKQKANQRASGEAPPHATPSGLDQPVEHPRIAQIKQALLPFTQLEVNETRADEFILINRGVAITAGDVRAARRAMRL